MGHNQEKVLEASKPISPPDGGFREVACDPGQVPWESGDQVEVLNGEYQGRYPQASNYPDYGPGMFDYQYSGLFTMNIDGAWVTGQSAVKMGSWDRS